MDKLLGLRVTGNRDRNVDVAGEPGLSACTHREPPDDRPRGARGVQVSRSLPECRLRDIHENLLEGCPG